MADTTKRDTAEREKRDRAVEAAIADAGDELAKADAARDRPAERKARRARDEAVRAAQVDEANSSPVIRRHTFVDDAGDELEGKAAVRAQQSAVVAAMDRENDRRYRELGIAGKPAHYADGTP